jgi:NtrC-family two-component system sensor histidine kinase KinB
MRTLQLKTRLGIAGVALIAMTIVTGVWSVTAFRRVSNVVSHVVTENQRVTDATGRLASTLEREDDALLLVLNDLEHGKAELANQRREVATALRDVTAHLETREAAEELQRDVLAYEASVGQLVDGANTADTRARYHEDVNQLKRRALATTTRIRDDHFRSSQSAAEWAADQSTRSMQIVATITIVALLLLVLIAIHLARVVMRPISEMTRAVQAIRRGDFAQRVGVRRDDELGRLGGGLNQMADELEQFRQTNIGEVVAAKETLEATLEALPDAVLVIGDDRRITAANPRANDVLGSTRERELADVPLPDSTRDAVDRVLHRGSVPDATVDLRKAIAMTIDGRSARLLPRVVPIAGRRGAVLVLSDVTELARLDDMRLELVAVASHELRTPLTTLKMTLSMLKERASRYESHDRQLVTVAAGGVEQLAGLVDEFLDLTRIEAGQLRLHWARVSLDEVITRTVAAATPSCEQAGLTLDVEHGEVPSIAADHARLAMVVSNLLSNAVKYTPEGGKIAIRTRATPATVEIVVEDSGPGVPVELRERVFERFFRIEREATPTGVGIGLYIAREVIVAHRGTITCGESTLGGARFVVTLPVEHAA